MPNISQVSRSCQSAPGYTETHDSARGSLLVDVGLQDDALMRADVDCDVANTWKRPRYRRRRRSSPSAAPASTCRPSPRRRRAGAGIQSMADTNER